MSAWCPPLGRPGRFSMTPAMQAAYRELAALYAATGQHSFRLCEIAPAVRRHKATAHRLLKDWQKRGWVNRSGELYSLTEPVMQFRPCTEGVVP